MPSYNARPQYNNNLAARKFNRHSNRMPINLTRAKLFLSNTLRDSTLITTALLRKEVYNIKDKNSPTTIGYLGYLVNKDKLDSLTSYLMNLGEKHMLQDYFIIINYSLDNKFFYAIIHQGVISYKEWVSNNDLSIAFQGFKNRQLSLSLKKTRNFKHSLKKLDTKKTIKSLGNNTLNRVVSNTSSSSLDKDYRMGENLELPRIIREPVATKVLEKEDIIDYSTDEDMDIITLDTEIIL